MKRRTGSKQGDLTSENLKQALWDTLQKLRNKKIQPNVANAIAKQSREILSVVRTELMILSASNEKPNRTLLKSGVKARDNEQEQK